jgi:hypothetical protein
MTTENTAEQNDATLLAQALPALTAFSLSGAEDASPEKLMQLLRYWLDEDKKYFDSVTLAIFAARASICTEKVDEQRALGKILTKFTSFRPCHM